MKKWIYGRRIGTAEEYSLLVESQGVLDSGERHSTESLQKQHAFEMRNLCRNVDIFREKGLEGYVLLEGDTTQYNFRPQEEFQIPLS
jgi:hypothetical protein